MNEWSYLFKKIFLGIPIAIEYMISKQKFSSSVHLWQNCEVLLLVRHFFLSYNLSLRSRRFCGRLMKMKAAEPRKRAAELRVEKPPTGIRLVFECRPFKHPAFYQLPSPHSSSGSAAQTSHKTARYTGYYNLS